VILVLEIFHFAIPAHTGIQTLFDIWQNLDASMLRFAFSGAASARLAAASIDYFAGPPYSLSI
jgi:hypothetical protein